MAKLNQIIAIEKGIKSRAYADVDKQDKAAQKPELFNGFSKEYQPKADDGEKLPSEGKRVQFTVPEVLRAVERATTELMNITARKDWTNCVAKGDVVLNGEPLLPGVPVTYLLFLEKQLTDLRTLVDRLPVLDVSDDWKRDENSGLYKTDPTQTHRTKKEQRALVLYPATAEHPAQTQMVTEDVIAGFWTLVKQSGAMPKPERDAMLRRVENLLQAAKQAREAANMVDELTVPSVGSIIFKYILED